MPTIRALLVEEDVLVKRIVADMVEGLGHSVAGEAEDVGTASKLAEDGQFYLATVASI
jgi:hypothetical protein